MKQYIKVSRIAEVSGFSTGSIRRHIKILGLYRDKGKFRSQDLKVLEDSLYKSQRKKEEKAKEKQLVKDERLNDLIENIYKSRDELSMLVGSIHNYRPSNTDQSSLLNDESYKLHKLQLEYKRLIEK